MFIQALQAHIMAFHFLFIFRAAVWNPCWKWRPFVQKSGWEGSALELFKGLQTLLITFKVVFLKALLKELHIHPLFKSESSNKFWSQRLNVKLFIYITEPTSFFWTILQCQRDQFIRDLGLTVRLISWVLAVLTAFLTTNTQTLPQSRNSSRMKCIFTDAISTLIGKALAQTSCLVILPQVIFRLNDQASAHNKLCSRRQPCFFCEIVSVLDRHSWFFPSWPKGAHKRSPKSTKALQPAAIKVLSSASVMQ